VLRCPVLLITGNQSIFNNTTKALHLAMLKTVADRTKVEFVQVASVANVLEEKVCRHFFAIALLSSIQACDC